jgi:S-(hydroxymethyl)glutathione dehydrogenase/alcohol dehydrogenase
MTRISRRRMIRQTMSAAAVGGAAFGSGDSGSALGQSAGIATGRIAGRRFKAWVSRGWGPNSTTLQELRLLPISGRQVLVRTEAATLCYYCAGQVAGVVLGGSASSPAPPSPSPAPNSGLEIQGHGAVGIVEAIGPEVNRVRVGDRVVVNVRPQCGRCYGCVTGRRPCMAANTATPVAEASNGTKVTQWGNIGGFSELVVPFEESVFPIVTSVPPRELAILSCPGGCGLGMGFSMVDRGSGVVVFGAGPVGLNAIQAARVMGAGQIVSVEPVRMRREMALKVGATAAIDPNAEGENLVPRLRDMFKGPSERVFGGGTDAGRSLGPDYVIEAVGQPYVRPREPGPDGIAALQQMWQLCPSGGKLYTCGVGYPAGTTVDIPAVSFTEGGKTHYTVIGGDQKPLRDIPRNVRLIEQGRIDMKSLVTTDTSIAQLKETYNAVLDYTTISAVLLV